jgi:hypothetical protein
VNLAIEFDHEEDGRWIAKAIDGIAHRMEPGEMAPSTLAIFFSIPHEQLTSH